MGWIEYAVVDDYGDDWENSALAYRSQSLQDCLDWAEDNYHSASIVKINTMLGERERVV